MLIIMSLHKLEYETYHMYKNILIDLDNSRLKGNS